MSKNRPHPSGRSSAIPDPRIISGCFRGQTIRAPHGNTHPMGSREKLALFNMVNVESARVLDAYAGSGALGLEALSRGAREVVFVESQPSATRVIRENLARFGVDDVARERNPRDRATFIIDSSTSRDTTGVSAAPVARVVLAKVSQYCSENARDDTTGKFDVIFADPPYDDIDVAEISLLGGLLASDGVLALSSPADLGEINLPGLRISSTHTYARARITIYRHEG